MKSITLKIGLIYIILTVLSLSIYTVTIYIEQIGLLTEKRELEIRLQAELLNNELEELTQYGFITDSNSELTNEELIQNISEALAGKIEYDFMIFKENGDSLYSSSAETTEGRYSLIDISGAIANRDLLNQTYLTIVDDKNSASLYFPFEIRGSETLIISVFINFTDIDEDIKGLYRIVFMVILFVLFLQFFFGFFFYSYVIRPIKEINKTSQLIKTGQYSSRVSLKRKDELGQLSNAFNEMAQSIEKVILELNNKNEVMKFELDTAGRVQSGIYPKSRRIKNIDAAIYHKPLEVVSGDYHDVVKIDEHTYGFLIADVSGHGIPAALMTMLIQNTFKRKLANHRDPGDLFHNINQELVDMMEVFSCYFTAFFFILDFRQNKIVYINGGHPSIYILRHKEKQLIELKTDGHILGVMDNGPESYVSQSQTIKEGDRIVLFTDGIVEAVNTKNEPFSLERFIESIWRYAGKSCEEMKDSIIHELDEFIGKEKRKDDETLMIIEVKKLNNTYSKDKLGLLEKAATVK
ncbi:MAG: SpoIIE family protein phosphatase [Spirochaetales bacterium]|nr:SpoIIE family protein phosphatase [Spirochaetales bacterium]